ncbi:hypothetical protein WDW86_22335 [Bdellovibrionota bacterium FG-2]
MFTFKKSLSIAVLSLFLATSITAPKESHALIGIGVTSAFGVIGAPILIGGIALTAVGATKVVTGLTSNTGEGLLTAMAFSVITGVGLLILDQDGAQTARFAVMTQEQALSLQVSNASLKIYNQNLDELNAIAATIATKLAAMKQPTIQDSARLWDAYKSELSPETFEVAGIISGAALQ